MFGNQFPNNQLGQSAVNPKARRPLRAPDTDSRLVKVVNGATSVTPNFMHDHTRFEYIIPSGNSAPVTFHTPTNTEDRSLHWLTLDNSNNSNIVKTFQFSTAYVFLDDPTNTDNIYHIQPNRVMVWYGTYTQGKLYLRIASESTN